MGNGEKGVLSDFNCAKTLGARRAGLSISKTADLLRLPRTTVSFLKMVIKNILCVSDLQT